MQVELFKKFLVESELTNADDAEGHTFWIYRFLTLKLPVFMSNEEKIAEFMNCLSLDDSVTESEREQAKSAVGLFLNDFYAGRTVGFDEIGNNRYMIIDALQGFMWLKQYSDRTIRVYADWAVKYLDFCDERKMQYDLPANISLFIRHLNDDMQVSASTCNQAVNALSFLFTDVLEVNSEHAKSASRIREPRKIPVILSSEELRSLFEQVDGTEGLILKFVFATGVTFPELSRIRVDALDFEKRLIRVSNDAIPEGRLVPMPESLVEPLREHLAALKRLCLDDVPAMLEGAVVSPDIREELSAQEEEWRCRHLFPSVRISEENKSGKVCRDQLSCQALQLTLQNAAAAAGINHKVSLSTLRHSFAAHLLMRGVNIRDLQKLLGHKNVENTMFYVQVLKRYSRGPVSPLDVL